MSWRATLAGLTVAGFCAAAETAKGQEDLVVDLSDDVIAITAGFSGSEVLAFGATDGAGDVIVIVRGPPREVVVRRKERIVGVWANRAQAAFVDVPSFYHLAASAPIDELLDADVLRAQEIGLDNLALATDDAAPDIDDFRAGLVRQQMARGLFRDDGDVRFVGERLFRTRVVFPANVPPGAYETHVLLVRGGEIVGDTTTRLHVSRFGFEARMFSFAHDQSALYGIVAIILALVAGWFAGFVFRKA